MDYYQELKRLGLDSEQRVRSFYKDSCEDIEAGITVAFNKCSQNSNNKNIKIARVFLVRALTYLETSYDLVLRGRPDEARVLWRNISELTNLAYCFYLNPAIVGKFEDCYSEMQGLVQKGVFDVSSIKESEKYAYKSVLKDTQLIFPNDHNLKTGADEWQEMSRFCDHENLYKVAINTKIDWPRIIYQSTFVFDDKRANLVEFYKSVIKQHKDFLDRIIHIADNVE